MMLGERCGDHLVAAYVAHVNAMKREFVRLAADGRELGIAALDERNTTAAISGRIDSGLAAIAALRNDG